MHSPNRSRDSLVFLSRCVPKREPTKPPAVGSSRHVGDTTRVSSVSAKLSWLGTAGFVGGQKRPEAKSRVLLGGRPFAKLQAHWGFPSLAWRAPALLLQRSSRIRLNFNTKGILGRRKCITRNGDWGRGEAMIPSLLTPLPSQSLGSGDETVRVPCTPQEPGEFKQGTSSSLPPPPSKTNKQ